MEPGFSIDDNCINSGLKSRLFACKMKVLLIGANPQIREARQQSLLQAGVESTAASPEEAEDLIADPGFYCLLLGSSLPESVAERLAARFNATGENRYVIRVLQEPVAKDYPYADFVVNPNNPAALLAAVKALLARSRRN